ncbi:HNH endonuclease [Paracoccus sp. KR1-242]|uniref:HNH endonuclease n=1 Tax=Paracoccus sp. KR1-242 TaxID=3410028 RepID=UPI003BFE2F15
MSWHRHSAHVIRTERWKRLRKEILRRDNYRCVKCGSAGMLECDHIKPVRDGGGEYDPANLQMLCKPCHAAKTRTEVFGGKVDPEASRWRKLLRGGI